MWYNGVSNGVPALRLTIGNVIARIDCYMINLPHICGIYKLTCLANDRFYIGGSLDVKKRCDGHFLSLRKGEHRNPYLQNAWLKYGELAFICELMEACSTDDLIEREQYYLDMLQPFIRTIGFNIAHDAYRPQLGNKLSLETRAKLSALRMGKTPNDETRAKISLSKLGNKHTLGLKHTEKSKAKMRIAQKGVNAKDFIVTTPSNVELLVHNLKDFCRTNGLTYPLMQAVVARKQPFHKGWQCRYANEPDRNVSRKHFVAISPSGLEIKGFNLKMFCRETELEYSAMAKVARGEREHYKGWSCRYA